MKAPITLPRIVSAPAADGPSPPVDAAAAPPGADRPSPDGAAGAPGAWRRRLRSRFTRRRLVWAAVGVAALLVVILLLRPSPVEVQVAEVTRGPLETTVDAEGVTRVRDSYQVAAPVGGRLERLALREGDAVSAGAVVARLHPVPLDARTAGEGRARVAAAEAMVREAGARADQAARAYEQAQRGFTRARTLGAAGAVSDEAVEMAEMEATVAGRELEAARSRAVAAAAEMAAARAALLDGDGGAAAAATVVRAPAAGRVLRVHARSEQVVAAGTPLLELGDAAGLEVAVEVLSSDAVAIRPGAPMRLVDWGGGEVLHGEVQRVEPSAFTRVSALGVEEQRVLVVGSLAAAPPLGDGYRVDARIVTWSAEDVVRVPASALFRTGERWEVFVVDDGRARRREVAIGRRGEAGAEVVGGLAPGERVIVFPSDRIEDGGRVRGR
jgi:HlyD family secretion protein